MMFFWGALCIHSLLCSLLYLFLPSLSLCTQDDAPLTFQACVIPKDCETSDWSSWSPCSKTCRAADLSPGYRIRTRIMTQIPIGGGRGCPALEEKEACNIIGDLLPNCPRCPLSTQCFITVPLGAHEFPK